MPKPEEKPAPTQPRASTQSPLGSGLLRIQMRLRDPDAFQARQRAVADAYRAAVAAGDGHPCMTLAAQFRLTPDYMSVLLRLARRPGPGGSPPLLEPHSEG